MHASVLRKKAFSLRERGYSYSFIAQKTGVSKSTLSGWLASVPYTPNQETIRNIGKARAASGAQHAKLKRASLEEARRQAVSELGSVSRRDLLMFGFGLYLGEGNKTADVVRIANSDPKVMRAAVAWFSILGVKKSQFAARIFLYPDTNLKESLHFWSRTTTIPMSQFFKPYIDRRRNKRLKNNGKLPFGTLHLSVRADGRKEFGSFFFRKIQAWNNEILNQI